MAAAIASTSAWGLKEPPRTKERFGEESLVLTISRLAAIAKETKRIEKGMSLVEQATGSPLPSWRFPAHGRGGKRAEEDEKLFSGSPHYPLTLSLSWWLLISPSPPVTLQQLPLVLHPQDI